LSDWPELHLPEFKMPPMPQMPKFQMPQMPNFQMPEIPEFKMPEFQMPEMPKMPEMPPQAASPGKGSHQRFGYYIVQGARGIDARFLELSPASAVSPIMTKFSQYTPHSTC
jgi:hypothetical protein